MSVYLLPAAIQAAATYRSKEHTDCAGVVYDAIDALRDRLPALVAARQAPERREGSLFPGRRESATAAARRTGQRRRLWFFQATTAELAVLDQLQTTSGARSRSELVSTAVEAYLLGRRRRSR
ncbi:hypothetical protein [Streptosporangium saharense]|uniref:Uncharacterized protein n=1 Tax=Streptosporangium saharense TaxID=1706840 RepID=A0A7W7VSB0_9ACTN|nr:hypothetical protein [Streptosporangium saharense]MBB4920952.1 hypothetical protein [Streptosporangium saharense]